LGLDGNVLFVIMLRKYIFNKDIFGGIHGYFSRTESCLAIT